VQHLNTLSVPDKRNDHYILLFYKSTCPACHRIMGNWKEFKHNSVNSNFTVIDFDSLDPQNNGIFEYFKIDAVPTLFKLKLDSKDYVQKMKSDVTLNNLHEFARF